MQSAQEFLTDQQFFAALNPPDLTLFYKRNDPYDRRLGELISIQQSDYQAAKVVLLGIPQDEGVRRNGGRTGAAEAPAAIRRCLSRLTILGLEHMQIVDLGDIQLDTNLEATQVRQRAVVRRVIADGKKLITIGGGNDISFPDCAALADLIQPILAFNIDTHFDVRSDTQTHSGTPYRQLLEAGSIQGSAFFEMAGQPFANSPIYFDYLQQQGASVYWLHELRQYGVETLFASILQTNQQPAIFWGFDMDAVRANDAPGVSAPNPTGLTAEEFCTLFRLAASEPRTRLIELSEVNPIYDLDQRTCRLAAIAIWHALTAFAS